MHGLYFKGGGRVSEGKVLRSYFWYENKGQIYNLILFFLFAQDQCKVWLCFRNERGVFLELKEQPFPLQGKGERTFRNHSHKVWKLPEAKQDGSKEDFSLWANTSTPSVAKKIVVKNCRAFLPKLIFLQAAEFSG